MFSHILIHYLLYLNLVLGLGFPVCPGSGVLNCFNDSDFTVSNSSGITIISNCIYVGCPSLIIDSTIVVINNVTFKDSVGPSIAISGGSHVNISNVQFYNSSLSLDGTFSIFNVIRCLFKSTGLKVTGSSHNISIDSSEFIDNQATDSGGAVSINSNDATISCIMTNSLFYRNSALNSGGAIYLNYLRSVYIFNSSFNENSSKEVGALVVNSVDFHISGCQFIGNSASSQMGAIYCRKGTRALIENSIFFGNTAIYYGVMELFSLQSATIRNCHFQGNSADDGAGSIQAEKISGYLEIDSCTFLNNSSPNGYAASLSLSNVNSCLITNSTFTSQRVYTGGGSIFSLQSNLFISNCAFVNCSSAITGGVMYLGQSSTTTISSTIFKNTFADQGGVIFAYSSNLNMINCFQYDSKASNGGASLYLIQATVTIQNCRFVNNSALDGGAILAGNSIVSISGSYFFNGSSYFGGQIYVYQGEVSISNCTFDVNSAYEGGFLYLYRLKENNLLSITYCQISNSIASFSGGALMLFSEESGNILIQDCSFYNSSALFQSGQMYYQGASTLMIMNCDFVNSFSSNQGIGSFYSLAYFTNCLFLNSLSLYGAGNLEIGSTAYILNCTVSGTKSPNGGFLVLYDYSNLIVSNTKFSDISAKSGGVIYGESGSRAVFSGCSFETVNALIKGVIAFTSGYLELTDCDVNESDSSYSSILFYTAGKTSMITIEGLRINGEIPDFDGSIMKCQSGGTALIKELSFSSSQSILLSVFSVDSLSSITISNSILIDIQGASLIKASSFSSVTVINCSISYSEGGSLISMDQVFFLESGCVLSLISSEIIDFQGTVAVVFALVDSSFNCFDSTIAGTRVPESAVKLYNGQMTSNNCSFIDNVSTGSVNECISSELGQSIVAVGGAIFGYSNSIFLTGGTIFSGNEADLGGAIYCSNCELIFDGVIMQENSASSSGGGIWCDSCNVQIGNCQVSGNKALNLPASNDLFLFSGQLSRSVDSSNISVYIGDDMLSNFILLHSNMTSFAGLRGLARSFSVLEYSDTINASSTSDNLPSITVVALDVFNEIVSIDPNDPIIIQVSLEGSNYSSYLSGERSKLMATEKMIFSDLEIVGKVPGASYNVTISSSNKDGISPKSITVFFQDCDSISQVLVKGTTCVPLLVGNSGGTITIISIFWMIIFPLIGISLVYLNKFRHNDLIKASSFTFLFLSGIGSLTAASAPIFYLIDLGCIPSIFLERIGFTLVFAALSLKVYRINSIFNSSSSSSLSDSRLIQILGILVLLIIIYLIVWVVLDPPKVTLTYSSQMNVVIKNSCPMDSPFAIVLDVAQFSAVLILSYLAFLTRSVPEKFNEAKVIGFACYNWLLFGSFFYLMAEYFITTPSLKLIIKSFSLYVSHSIITVFLITAKIHRIQRLRHLDVSELEHSDAIESSGNMSFHPSFFTGSYFESRTKSK